MYFISECAQYLQSLLFNVIVEKDSCCIKNALEVIRKTIVHIDLQGPMSYNSLKTKVGYLLNAVSNF